jgi:hypothetical protein
MTQQEIIKVANEIKASFNKGAIKDIEFPPLVNMRTLEDIGMGVIFQLSTKFDYDEATIMEWKNKLGADDWYINVKRNQLRLTYYIHF